MVNQYTDTFNLISNSKSVATIGGTVGWESMVRGIPVLLFGNVWYAGCSSAFQIRTLDDAIKAMEEILSGFEPDLEDIKRYALSIHAISDNRIIHDNFHENINKSGNPEKIMEHISDKLYEAYNYFYLQE